MQSCVNEPGRGEKHENNQQVKLVSTGKEGSLKAESLGTEDISGGSEAREEDRANGGAQDEKKAF